MEEGTATHSGVLAWRIPWTEDPGGHGVHRVAQSGTRLKRLSMHALNMGYGTGHAGFLFFPRFYWSRVDLQSCVSFRCPVSSVSGAGGTGWACFPL